MKIEKIVINNFLGIEKLALEFRHPGGKPLDMVVLAGPNGCGKTSVLEACILALGRSELLPNFREKSQYIRKGSEKFAISATLVTNNDGTWEVKITSDEEPIIRESGSSSGILVYFLLEKATPVRYFSSWRYPKLIGSVPVSIGNKNEKPSDTEDNRLYRIKQHLINLTASKAFEDDETLVSEEKEAYKTINTLWKYFYPNRNEQFVAKRVSGDASAGFDIFLEGRASKPVPIDSLSSGEIEVFTLIGQKIIHPVSGGIIFIDEPELHLHSSWHRVILRVLRKIFSGNQIICATHSQEIIDSAASYERFTLLPEHDPRIRMDKSEGGM
ncbi:MAG: hypothetical protein BWK80_27935 [Desulfobacteraceae bacterium IS3]|nr:MAG: hypothetical protein BWK80_27935 [Desulfobacteraceae bacterium IS3]